MKICQRCGTAVTPDRAYDAYDHVSASAGGITFYVHRQCRGTPHQSTQEGPVVLPLPGQAADGRRGRRKSSRPTP